ncbi:hypothetical protein AMK22_09345 [Streptomyces sp. CB01580]|nr:hypothetical protein AMK22_09345 [Streptomyces sp. CB01580]
MTVQEHMERALGQDAEQGAELLHGEVRTQSLMGLRCATSHPADRPGHVRALVEPVERQHTARQLQVLDDLLVIHVALGRQVDLVRYPSQALEPALCLPDLSDRISHIDRVSDHGSAVRHSSVGRLPDPPSRVGGELQPSRDIKFLHRTYQAEFSELGHLLILQPFSVEESILHDRMNQPLVMSHQRLVSTTCFTCVRQFSQISHRQVASQWKAGPQEHEEAVLLLQGQDPFLRPPIPSIVLQDLSSRRDRGVEDHRFPCPFNEVGGSLPSGRTVGELLRNSKPLLGVGDRDAGARRGHHPSFGFHPGSQRTPGIGIEQRGDGNLRDGEVTVDTLSPKPPQ